MPLSNSVDNSAIYTDPATWRPNVPASELFEEKTWLQGALISAVAYGAVVTLFFLDLSLIWPRVFHSGKWTQKKIQSVALLIYICILFLLSTLTIASQAQMTQYGFIDYRNFPGGPALFQDLMFSIPISFLGIVAFVLMNWFSDCLLLWRCLVIYRSAQVPLPLVMAFPSMMLFATFVSGVIYMVQISRPGANDFTTAIPTLIYTVISLGLNLVLTIMIVVRLFLHRRRVVKAIGTRHGSQYTGIIAMLVESAFILDVFVIFFLIAFCLGSPVANIPLSTIVQISPISSLMIIFRVASGNAWASNTVNELLTTDFAARVAELSVIEFTGTNHGSGHGTGTAVERSSIRESTHSIHSSNHIRLEKLKLDEEQPFPTQSKTG